MPKKIPDQELEAILTIIEAHPGGVQARTIRNDLTLDLPPRMLQRRLSLLAEQNKIQVKGKGKGTKYFPTTFSEKKITTATAAPKKGEIKLSTKSREIKSYINRPLSSRDPIGYQKDFLDRYEPNVTTYLSTQTKQQLLKMGTANQTELPAGTYIRQVYNRLLIDLSWNSSRLEGNTYSLLETQLLIELGENAEDKDTEEAQMILNHKAAIEMLVEQANEIGFNRYTINNLHALLSDNLMVDPSASGRVRRIPVGISGSVYHPLEVPQMINESYLLILEKAEAIKNAYEQSFFIMAHLPYLQPFEDVNKRVSRMAANIPLIKHNLCPLSFIDVSQQEYINAITGIYELNKVDLLRDVYIWAYERSCKRYSAVQQSIGEPDPFRLKYRQAIKECVAVIVKDKLNKNNAVKMIKQYANKKIAEKDTNKFIEVVETELMSLHEGNIARYRIKPSEYNEWQSYWR